MDIYDVNLSTNAKKNLRKVPVYIVTKLQSWIDAVKHQGLNEVRKVPGYHDEPLQGKRIGQRSIRLNRSYRAIYSIQKDLIEFVEIEEVTNHEY